MAFYRCGGGNDPTGDAQPADVRNGKTFSNSSGTGKVGTMTNHGNWSPKLHQDNPSVTLPEGYYNGSGTASIDTYEIMSITPRRDKAVTVSLSDQANYPTWYHKVPKKISAASSPLTNVPYKPNKRSSNIDMYTDTGATVNPVDGNACYKYLDTTSVPNSNTGMYSLPSDSNEKEFDMGAANTYRYINARGYYNHANLLGYNRANLSQTLGNIVALSDSTNPSVGDTYDLTCEWEGSMLLIKQCATGRGIKNAPTITPVNNLAQQETIVEVFALNGIITGSGGTQSVMVLVTNVKYGAQFDIFFANESSDVVQNLYARIMKLTASLSPNPTDH